MNRSDFFMVVVNIDFMYIGAISGWLERSLARKSAAVSQGIFISFIRL